MHQLSFSFGHNALSLRQYLEKATRKPISLVITNNSTSMISYRSGKGEIILRLHSMFLSADYSIIDEIAAFIRNGRQKTPLIREFINRNRNKLRAASERKIRVRTCGRYFDLKEIFGALNQEYFDGRISASVTWGSRGPRRVARKRTLGSYNVEDNVIRINPMLDAARVPRYFIRYIVYHEMLHADIGIENTGGRRVVHSREFKRRERLFKDYERAVAWEKRHWG